ncbi:hypothetical protein ACFVVQ_25520 [Paenibacillus chitinolyticus]
MEEKELREKTGTLEIQAAGEKKGSRETSENREQECEDREER